MLESAAESREAATVVENDEIVKGYEYSKGQYVIIEPSELDNLRVPSKHTIAVSQFIDVSELNPEYVEKPYFATPENDMQAEAFNVVRQALVNSRKAAVGKESFSGRENIIAVVPTIGDDRGMMSYTLRYHNELRDQSEYFRTIKQPPPINADSLELAETLIARMLAKLAHLRQQMREDLRLSNLAERGAGTTPPSLPSPRSAALNRRIKRAPDHVRTFLVYLLDERKLGHPTAPRSRSLPFHWKGLVKSTLSRRRAAPHGSLYPKIGLSTEPLPGRPMAAESSSTRCPVTEASSAVFSTSTAARSQPFLDRVT